MNDRTTAPIAHITIEDKPLPVYGILYDPEAGKPPRGYAACITIGRVTIETDGLEYIALHGGEDLATRPPLADTKEIHLCDFYTLTRHTAAINALISIARAWVAELDIAADERIAYAAHTGTPHGQPEEAGDQAHELEMEIEGYAAHLKEQAEERQRRDLTEELIARVTRIEAKIGLRNA